MAILAIKGNSDRSEDIKKLFTDLGASEIYFECCDENYLYYMSHDKKVTCIPDQPGSFYLNQLLKVYTIEEFETQFPFRVGDIVVFDIYTGVKGFKKGKTSGIKSMCWLHEFNEVCYITEDEGKHFAQAFRVLFEPKDGDVVACEGYIFLCKSHLGDNEILVYCGYSFYEDRVLEDGRVYYADHIATEEEKRKLFDKLKEKGLAWDAEKKELVKLKWEPNIEEEYWFPSTNISTFTPLYIEWTDSVFDRARFESGWIFRSEEECQAFCDKLNQAIERVEP